MFNPVEKGPTGRMLEGPTARRPNAVPASEFEDLFRACADFWRTLAHAKRLQILAALRDREANVSTLANELELSPVNVSQELAPLRAAGLVKTRREGKRVFYRVAHPKLEAVCELVAEVMRDVTTARARVVLHDPDRTAPVNGKSMKTQTFTPWKP